MISLKLAHIHKNMSAKLINQPFKRDLLDLALSPNYGKGVVRLEWNHFKRSYLRG